MCPTLFRVGPVTVQSYGVMLVTAFAAGILLAIRLGRRDAFTSGQLLDLVVVMAVSGIVGARLVYLTLNLPGVGWREVLSPQGLTFYGGLGGGALAALAFCRRRRQSFRKLADMLAPSLALGYAIGRIGCFLNGCCYGIAASGPLAVEGHHPTQLYSSFGSLLIMVILLWLRRRPTAPGTLFLSYLAMYSVMRSVVEIWRAGNPVLGPLTDAQLASMVVLAASLSGIIWLKARTGRMVQPTAQPHDGRA